MNFLIDPLKNLKGYKDLSSSIEKGEGPVLTYGIGDESIGHIVYGLNYHLERTILLITYDELSCKEKYEELVNLGIDNVYYFPRREVLLYDIDAQSKERENERLRSISRLISGEKIILVASIDSVLDRLTSPRILEEYFYSIEVGMDLDPEEFIKSLASGGYERVSIVEAMGQFSFRGGILDIYSPSELRPVRIEFFDIEVDSIREFDPISQRSLEGIEKTRVSPAKEVLFPEEIKDLLIENLENDLERGLKKKGLKDQARDKLLEKFSKYLEGLKEDIHITNRDLISPYFPREDLASLVDYLDQEALVLIHEIARVKERAEGIISDYQERYIGLLTEGELLEGHSDLFIDYLDLISQAKSRCLIANNAILSQDGGINPKKMIKFITKSTQSYHNKLEIFLEDIRTYKYRGYKTVVLASNEDRARKISRILDEEEIVNTYSKDLSMNIRSSQVFVSQASIKSGVEYPEIKFAIISDNQVFGQTKKRSRPARSRSKQVNFTDLRVNDYVVHENHGIGLYEGVERLDLQGVKKDYLRLRYGGKDLLYVPIDQMNLIQKYIGTNKLKPKINKLSSGDWARAKKRARKTVEEMAEDLILLYAKRKEAKGFQFSKDSQWQREFEDYFPYEETYGQRSSIEEIKKDMESPRPMERLLCGDVGFGKTEVALRAAFKAVLDGKQVAFLVPTTILAQQHYNTILKRFENFPVNVAMLSRFRTKSRMKVDIENIKTGVADIVVGTHRLLSKDIVFKDLGLLIIDEEQRFGVKDKEKMKELKETIDVLTLTATPIPRTLHMSLSGIRDMSVIEEPPEERYPIQTYVVEYNPQVIRDGITRELARGGQVYFVHNRVESIDRVASELRKLVPEASFVVAHGQMPERELEKVMVDFYEKEYDVLVCTTIIETGLDIPNVNTIIIKDSDKMGLSQLYQLRGRVGRSNRIAYGYFTYEANKVLSPVAEKRLKAIKEFTEFGSGFKIAMRDLEIRGAGNLLGLEQHGQIEAIGYDLYVKFLNEAILKFKGEELEELVDTSIDLAIDGYIREDFISDEDQRIEIYKKTASITSDEDYMDLVDELIDRFGDVPREVDNLMKISHIRYIGSKNNIKSIRGNGEELSLEFNDINKISPLLIGELSSKYKRRLNISLSSTAFIKYKYKGDVLTELKALLEFINQVNLRVQEERRKGDINVE